MKAVQAFIEVLMFFILLLLTASLALKQDTARYTGRLSLVTIDTNETDSVTRYYIDSAEDGQLRVDFTYQPTPPPGRYVVLYGNVEKHVLKVENHTILPENHLEGSSGPGNPDMKSNFESRFQGERSVGVFFFEFTESICGSAGSNTTCQYCRTFNETLDFFFRKSENNVVGFFNEVSEGTVRLLINESSVFKVLTDQNPSNLYNSFDNIVESVIGVDPKVYDHSVFLLPWNWFKISPFDSFSLQGVGETPGSRTWIKGCDDDTILHELGNQNFAYLTSILII